MMGMLILMRWHDVYANIVLPLTVTLLLLVIEVRLQDPPISATENQGRWCSC